MRASNPFQFSLAALLLVACSGSDPDGVAGTSGAASDSGAIERVVKEVVVSSGTPVTLADLSIEGMSCEMMCGGSIRKALAKLPGVDSTMIVFNEGDELDHAVVTYNEAEVSDAQLVEAIHALYDGQYTVRGITITRQVKGQAGTGAVEVQAADEGKVSVYAPAAVLLPNVITLISRVLNE